MTAGYYEDRVVIAKARAKAQRNHAKLPVLARVALIMGLSTGLWAAIFLLAF